MEKDTEKRLLDFMDQTNAFHGEMRQYIKDRDLRCGAHIEEMRKRDERISSLEGTRDYLGGAMKAVAVGAPILAAIVMWVLDAWDKVKYGVKGH